MTRYFNPSDDRIYAAAGCKERLRLVVGPEGHRFCAGEGWAAVRVLQA